MRNASCTTTVWMQQGFFQVPSTPQPANQHKRDQDYLWNVPRFCLLWELQGEALLAPDVVEWDPTECTCLRLLLYIHYHLWQSPEALMQAKLPLISVRVCLSTEE